MSKFVGMSSSSAPSYSLSTISDHPAHFWFPSNLLAYQRPATKGELIQAIGQMLITECLAVIGLMCEHDGI